MAWADLVLAVLGMLALLLCEPNSQRFCKKHCGYLTLFFLTPLCREIPYSVNFINMVESTLQQLKVPSPKRLHQGGRNELKET
jgi:hypothetical protein